MGYRDAVVRDVVESDEAWYCSRRGVGVMGWGCSGISMMVVGEEWGGCSMLVVGKGM